MAIKRKVIQGTLSSAIEELQTEIIDGWRIEDDNFAIQPLGIGGVCIYIQKDDGVSSGEDDEDMIGTQENRSTEELVAEQEAENTTKTTTGRKKKTTTD